MFEAKQFALNLLYYYHTKRWFSTKRNSKSSAFPSVIPYQLYCRSEHTTLWRQQNNIKYQNCFPGLMIFITHPHLHEISNLNYIITYDKPCLHTSSLEHHILHISNQMSNLECESICLINHDMLKFYST